MDQKQLESLKKRLIEKEGYRTKPYLDTVGKWTIGVGYNLSDNGIPKNLIHELLDVCVLPNVRLSHKTIDALLTKTLDVACNDAMSVLALETELIWSKLAPARKNALIEMAFNLGYSRLLTFRKMWAAIDKGDWETASAEALDSKWATQVGTRAEEIAEMLRRG